MPMSKQITNAQDRPNAAGVRVLSVEPNSLGQRFGIEPNDSLIAINGHPIHDVLDYWFYSSARRIRVEWVSHRTGTRQSRTALKTYEERLGLEVEPFEIRRCNNACVFCFVHQLPQGLRPELYVKDEDFRLSFLYGNYITGTTLTEADMKRIVRQKLSPLYFSVHATDESVRRHLLANPNPPPILDQLDYLTRRGIAIHTQIVLCPSINDGAVLEQTVRDLSHFYPMLESIAVVPVGLTSHRQRLPKLQNVTPAYARAFLRHCRRIQQVTRQSIGYPLVFPSDEFYLIAGQEPPSYDEFSEIPQIENGVGMVSRFYAGFSDLLRDFPSALPSQYRVAAITTVMGQKVIQNLMDAMNERIENLRVEALTVTNSLFGPGITVTGLLPGRDFLSAIQTSPNYDLYLIPENALRPWDQRFLDDMTFQQLETKASKPIRVGGSTAATFAHAALADFSPC